MNDTAELDNHLKIAEKVGDIIRTVKQIDQMPDLQDFFANGFLDSFDIIRSVDELEKAFQVTIKGKYITEDNFKSVEAIAKLIVKLKHE